jgi:hypothetical protein
MSLLRWLGLALVGFILALLTAGWLFTQELAPIGTSDKSVLYRIQMGATFGQVTQDLGEKKTDS